MRMKIVFSKILNRNILPGRFNKTKGIILTQNIAERSNLIPLIKDEIKSE
jgi:hypothetical protein